MIFITANSQQNNFSVNKNYCDAISKFGQTPILISTYNINLIDKIIKLADGILLSGGGDIHPKFFNQHLHPKSNNINTKRDEFEIALCKKTIEKNLPLLGICRGIQILNVALGGNIFHHIPNHMQSIPRDLPSHFVNPQKSTKFFEIAGAKEIQVNSLHHQAIHNLGKNLIISSLANDGVIESVEHTQKKFIMGVQWHPEALNKIYTVQNKIFQAFVESTLN